MSTTLKCFNCQDIITSSGHRHNFVSCKCGKCFVDGGDSYSRFGGDHFYIFNNNSKEWEEFNLTEEK